MNFFAWWVGASLAAPGTELALVLDNSCSMAQAHSDPVDGLVPGNDPERVAVLGAMLVAGLSEGSDDRVTAWGFGSSILDPVLPLSGVQGIRDARYAGGTWFLPSLREAAKVLEASERERRLLLFFTDGAPEDGSTPAQLVQELRLDEGRFGTFVLGLYGSEGVKARGEAYLRPLARDPEDLVFLDGSKGVVSAFTEGYARALGSRALVGQLSPGEAFAFTPPPLVAEVLVATATVDPGPGYRATLTGPGGAVPSNASGDNGCPEAIEPTLAPGLCGGPRRSFATFRAPSAAGGWRLALEDAAGPVEYGVILRYDLDATVEAPERARVGEPVPITAHLASRGAPVTPDQLPLTVTARIDGREVPLRWDGQAWTGSWTPEQASNGRPMVIEARFRSPELDLAARDAVTVEGWLPFTLVGEGVDLGAWRGERGDTERCATVDLSRSTNIGRVSVACTPQDGDLTLRCEPVPESASPSGFPTRWQVCGQTRGCCGDLTGPGAVVFAGTDAHYAETKLTVPVAYAVTRTGFLRCWWPVLAALAALAALLWFVWGWLSPRAFDPALAVRVAGSEAGLRQAQGLVLRELPGGQRGFYRHARVSMTGGGDFVRRPGQAAVVVEAGPGGPRWRRAAGVEQLDRRTRRWEAVDPKLPVEPGQTYRVGGLHFKLG